MLSVFDRIKLALADGKTLSKSELFSEAKMPNSDSNRALFQVLVQNNKLIAIGKGRARKYCLPFAFSSITLPQEGLYSFKQKLDGKIYFMFDEDEPIELANYDEFVTFMKRRLLNG